MPPVITSLDFSPCGKLLAVAGYHEVLLHKADGSGLVARLVGVSERIESVSFSPDGKRLAVTGGLPARMGEVQVWDVEKNELTLSCPVTHDTVYGASWSRTESDRVWLCRRYGASDRCETGEQVLYRGLTAIGHWTTVFSAKGTHLVSVGRDRSAKLTEVETERFVDNVTSITPGALKRRNRRDRPASDQGRDPGRWSRWRAEVYRMFRTSKRVIGDDANLIRKFPRLKGRVFDVAISRDGKLTVGVVDDLEMVDVDHDHRGLATGAPVRVQVVVEAPTVRQSGQPVASTPLRRVSSASGLRRRVFASAASPSTSREPAATASSPNG